MVCKGITIFGAGSAGLLSALSLSSSIHDIAVTLISPKKFDIIGVGESTQPDLVQLLDNAGVDLIDFIEKTDASLKHGIYYKNWHTTKDEYWHAFSRITEEGFLTRAHFAALKYSGKDKQKYFESVHESYNFAAKNHKSSTAHTFALHLDARLLCNYLLSFLKNRIRIIECDEFEIVVDEENNKIDYLVLDGEKHTADLYIDSTGFSKALIGKLKGLKEDNYEGNVNAAVFGRVYYDNEVKRFPYTRAEAHKYGWFWTAPLRSKIGTGCVYNSNYLSKDDAKKLLIDYWGGRIKEENVNSTSFSSSSLTNPWISNVCSIGLSAGFIEPLEATGISWFIRSVALLQHCLQHRYYDENTINQFNSNIRLFITDVQDYVDAHYMLSQRNDSQFWIDQRERKRSDRLLQRLALYKQQMPNKSNRPSYYEWAFNDVSWLDLLVGNNFEFDKQIVDKQLEKILQSKLMQPIEDI